jgi:hypothetical protein
MVESLNPALGDTGYADFVSDWSKVELGLKQRGSAIQPAIVDEADRPQGRIKRGNQAEAVGACRASR